MASLLEKHLESLSAARESLATFLRERFNIENLLSVRKPVSRFDRITPGTGCLMRWAFPICDGLQVNQFGNPNPTAGRNDPNEKEGELKS
jgi:hypothetical protein